jgi:hypothetical protein
MPEHDAAARLFRAEVENDLQTYLDIAREKKDAGDYQGALCAIENGLLSAIEPCQSAVNLYMEKASVLKLMGGKLPEAVSAENEAARMRAHMSSQVKDSERKVYFTGIIKPSDN